MAKSHIFDDDFVRKYRNDVAIIGIGCRFPGADNYHQYWVNMKNGVDSIQEIGERWDVDKFYSTDLNKPNTTNSKWCGKINNIDIFDNSFFNISPREARNMDPQQRLLLEESWHCIEDSSIPLNYLREKKTSVYIGVMASDYHQEASSEDVIIDSYAGLGNYNCILANRISYFFGFSGVSMAVDAACASSLVAIHQGRHSLLNMESDYVIAGGVAINTHPWKYISFSKSRMFSPDGRCKTFDKDANGYVPGEGIAVILMQRVSEAIRDGNHIYGIIKGSAVNHGGATRSITAPRVEAQKELILTSFREAAFSPETLTYTEAHGTGTSLGDPIEVEALTRVFKEFLPYEVEYDDFENNILQKVKTEADHAFIRTIYIKDKRKSRYILIEDSDDVKERLKKLLLKINYLTHKNSICKIGSVKTNIGHLEAAAGVAGLIKVLMMMKYRQIPPLVHLKTPNPIINWQYTPFTLAKELSDWKPAKRGLPLRAGVSSFGFGGVNSHLLLEEFPQQYKVTENEKDFFNLFMLSARSKESFHKLAKKWQGYLTSANFQKFTLKDICMNLSKGRADFPYRAGIKVKKKGDLEQQLTEIVKLMHKQEDRVWCLRLGEFDWNGYSKTKSLIENHPFNNKIYTELEELLKKLNYKADFSKGFKSSKWAKDKTELYTFVSGYIFIESLYRLGFKPAVITAERSSVLLGLVSSGIISLQMALEVLIGKRGIKDILFIRPRIPFFDYLSKKTAMPFHFDEEYLKLLVTEVAEKNRLLGQILVDSVYDEEVENNVETRLGALLLRNKIITEEQLNSALELQSSSGHKIGDIILEQKFCREETLAECLKQQSILHYYLDEVIYRDKALLLSDSQFTFKRYLEEWDEILARYGRKISSMMGNKKIISGKEGASIKEKALLMLIIMSSLKKLNQKWNLTDQKLEEELRFYELIDLVVDNVMPKDLVAELFLEEEPDYTKIKHTLNIRQKYGNVDKSYTYIRDTNKNIKEVPNTEAWYNAAIKAEPILAEEVAYIPVNKLSHINFGMVAHPATEAHSFTPDLTQPLEESIKDTALQLWMGGTELNWQDFYQDVQYHRLPLPLYAFSGKSFWIKKREGDDKQSEKNQKYYIVKKDWIKAPILANENKLSQKPLIIIAGREHEQLVNKLKETFKTKTITIYNDINFKKTTGDSYTISFTNDNDGRKAIEAIYETVKEIETLIDLSDLNSLAKDEIEVAYGKLAILQEVIKNRDGASLNILHFTAGLQNFKSQFASLAGSDMAGFIKPLNGEYPGINAKTVDLEQIPQDDSELSSLILNEINSKEEETEICYRSKERYLPQATALFAEESSQSIDNLNITADKTVVITGGTRGIGAEVARYLASKGVKKLVLMGAASLPPREEWEKTLDDNTGPSGTVEKIRKIIALEKMGAQVAIYNGSLTDEKSLTTFFTATRKKLGPIGGVIHCAGILSSGDKPEFINKKSSDLAKVLEPKIPGLQTLHKVFKKDKLDYFILFSSVSSFIPALANRVIDYGASNSFLSYYADYQNRKGNKYYKAICWPSWKEVGMKVAESFIYHNMGLTAHTNSDGLFLLEKCMDYQEACLMPLVVEDENLFQLNKLFKIERPGKVKREIEKEEYKADEDDIINFLLKIIASKLECTPDEIAHDDSFFSMGIESIMIKEISGELEKNFENLSSTMLFEYPNVSRLAQYLKERKIKEDSIFNKEQGQTEQVAAIDLKGYLTGLIADKIECPQDEIDPDDSFFSMGIESIMIKEISGVLENKFDNLSSTLLFEYPNINKLSDYLKEKKLKDSTLFSNLSSPLSCSKKLSDSELLKLFDQLKAGEIEIEAVEKMTEGMYE